MAAGNEHAKKVEDARREVNAWLVDGGRSTVAAIVAAVLRGEYRPRRVAPKQES
jgi:hypothetical protein